MTWALRSATVVLPDEVRPATLVISDGRIVDLLGHADGPADAVDVGSLTVSPGLVDSHVHINEPGRTHWEGFATATRAAAAGGVTTLVDMPLNSIPPTTTVEALELKRSAAAGAVHVDVAFWGGVTSTDTSSVSSLVEAGVCGFKVFLVPSGVDEFGWVDAQGLAAALTAAGDLPVLVHAEAPGPLEAAPEPQGRSYAAYLASRPPAAEVVALEMVLAGLRATGGRAHILHLSSADGLAVITRARREGCGSASRPARTIFPLLLRTSPTAPPRPSAPRRSAARPTVSCCGRRSGTAPSTSSPPTTRRPRRQ